ncbi:Protein SRE-42 [Aphelenchoides avenae]|nr:Protein SRE-42 [Aphelenchus avenae]
MDTYSLKRRFQIQENIRIVQLIKRIYTVSLAFLVLGIAVVLPMMVADVLSFRNYVIESVDIAIAAFANVISLVILSGTPTFRGGFGLRSMCRCIPVRPSVQVEDCDGAGLRNAFGTQLMFGQREEAEVYFQQFRNAWD